LGFFFFLAREFFGDPFLERLGSHLSVESMRRVEMLNFWISSLITVCLESWGKRRDDDVLAKK
jgi:hypothetical protein